MSVRGEKTEVQVRLYTDYYRCSRFTPRIRHSQQTYKKEININIQLRQKQPQKTEEQILNTAIMCRLLIINYSKDLIQFLFYCKRICWEMELIVPDL